MALFHIDRMQHHRRNPRPHNEGRTHVYTWVPQWLQDRIRARAEIHGAFIFGAHETKDLDVITDLWRRKLTRFGTCAARGK